MNPVKVSSKGWVVIPSEIRERHGIRPGDLVHVVDYGERIAIVPALDDPVADGKGLLSGGSSLTDALLGDRREERRREDG